MENQESIGRCGYDPKMERNLAELSISPTILSAYELLIKCEEEYKS